MKVVEAASPAYGWEINTERQSFIASCWLRNLGSEGLKRPSAGLWKARLHFHESETPRLAGLPEQGMQV